MSLSYDQQSNVIGKAPGKLLKGGLGGMGVGTMWFDGDDTDPAYADVPEKPFEPGMMFTGRPPEPLSPERRVERLAQDLHRAHFSWARDMGYLPEFAGFQKWPDVAQEFQAPYIEAAQALITGISFTVQQ